MDSCSFSDCVNPPEYMCKCQGSASIFCKTHLEIHSREITEHNITKNYIEVSEGDRIILSAQCSTALKKLQKIREDALILSKESIQVIINSTVACTQAIREKESIYNSVIDYFQRNDKIIKKTTQSPLEEFILTYIASPQEIYSDLIKQEILLLQEIDIQKRLIFLTKSLTDSVEKYSILEQHHKKLVIDFKLLEEENSTIASSISRLSSYISEAGMLDLLSPPQTSPIMCYFDDDSKILNLVDPLSPSDIKFCVEIPDNLSYDGAFCKLPNDQMLYYGGSPSKQCLDIVYLVDIRQRTAVKKSSHKPMKGIGECCYHQGLVYTFGGLMSDKTTCEAYAYSIELDLWQNISPMPSVCGYATCALVGNGIALAGKSCVKMYKYDVEGNSYSGYGDFSTSNKILCYGLGKIFIFESGKLYESIGLEHTDFCIINGSTGVSDRCLKTYVTRCDMCIYFLLWYKFIYKFNLLTKQVSKIRMVIANSI